MTDAAAGDRLLEQLTRVSRAVTYASSLDDVLRLAADNAALLLGAERAVLMLVDDDGLLHVRAAHGVAPERAAGFRAPMDEALVARVRALFADGDADGASEDFLGVPLVVRGQVTGLLAVLGATGARGAEEQEWLLSALADQTAAPIELARLDDELRRGLRQAKERALAAMAHDLRSPLQAIEGYAQLVEEEIMGPITAEQRGALQRIRMSGRHILALQESLFEQARSGAETSAVDIRPTGAAEILRDAAAIVRDQAAAKGQALAVDEAPDVPNEPNEPNEPHASRDDVRVLADPGKLRRVLVNLLSNAVKYTPSGGRVVARARLVEAGGGRWGEMAVSDTGVGIAPEHTAEIFQPYVRLRQPGTAGESGVGLGLAICRELVGQMGGEIRVESEPGVGSTFTVRLPAAESGS